MRVAASIWCIQRAMRPCVIQPGVSGVRLDGCCRWGGAAAVSVVWVGAGVVDACEAVVVYFGYLVIFNEWVVGG